MKTKSKAIVLIMCALILVSASVLGTVAYLTAKTEEVHNTFSVGAVELKLDEADVDEYGVTIETAPRVTGNDYKLIPGHTYVKDPTVHIDKNSEPCYVSMTVEIVNYATLLEKLENPENYLPEDFVSRNKDYWECASYGMAENGKDMILEFRHNDIITVTDTANDETLPALFGTMTLPDEVKNMDGLEDLEINVYAQAIQADGFNGDADAAFQALADAAAAAN